MHIGMQAKSANVARKDELQKWLEAVPEPAGQAASLNRPRIWLKDRRRERARKGVRRRVQKTLQNLWDIEKRLVSQGLASSPIHVSLTRIMSDLTSFLDDYDRHTSE